MAGHAISIRRQVLSALKYADIALLSHRIEVNTAGEITAGEFPVIADAVLGATGASPPAWLARSGLATDAAGFLQINSFQQSVSDDHVFAAGDVSSSSDPFVTKSGVHSVRAGPVLAENLLSTLDQRPLVPYVARRTSRYLLSTGDGRAIVSWGKLNAAGRWVWWWKDHIDRRFMNRFRVR